MVTGERKQQNELILKYCAILEANEIAKASKLKEVSVYPKPIEKQAVPLVYNFFVMKHYQH